MKIIKRYLTGTVLVLLFACVFLGTRAQAAAPGQVTGVKQTGDSSTSVKLEWDALLDNDVYYQVDISTDKKNWVTKEEKAYDSYETIYGLNAATTYYVRVRGYKQESYNSEKEYGAWSSVTDCVTSPKKAPSYLRKTDSTATSMTITWGKVSGANAYVVEYGVSGSSSDKLKSVTVTTNTATLKKLTKNETYTVYVYAVRRNSDKSYTTSGENYYNRIYVFDFGVTPGKVKGVECDYYWQALKEISVKYKTIGSADGYQVEVWTANKTKDTRLATAEGDSFGADIAKNVFGKHNAIKIRVRAYSKTYDDTKKYGAWSEWTYTAPQPDISKIKSVGKGLKVSFDKISGADRYVIYASTKKTSGYKKVAVTTSTSYIVTKVNNKALKKGTTYYFYVVPQKKVGSAYYSLEAGNADSCWYNKY